MNGVAHIVFKFREERIEYLKLIVEEFENYPFKVDVFIHCDKKLKSNLVIKNYKNGQIFIKTHNLKKYILYKGWKYRLTFKARESISKQANNYDIFIYLEDDILIPKNAINYWLKYKNLCLQNKLNLGFLRIEVKDGTEYLSDLTSKLNNEIQINNIKFIINDLNPYTAFWIYDKKEFKKWLNSDYYDLKKIHGFNNKNSRVLKFLHLDSINYLQYLIYDRKHKRIDSVMEASAFGLAYPGLKWYENTVIKLENNKVDRDCLVFHLSNNYVNENITSMGTLKLEDLVDFT